MIELMKKFLKKAIQNLFLRRFGIVDFAIGAFSFILFRWALFDFANLKFDDIAFIVLLLLFSASYFLLGYKTYVNKAYEKFRNLVGFKTKPHLFDALISLLVIVLWLLLITPTLNSAWWFYYIFPLLELPKAIQSWIFHKRMMLLKIKDSKYPKKNEP